MQEILEMLRAGDPKARKIVETAKKLLIDHRDCHKGCDVGNVIHCDLFYEMIEKLYESEQAGILQERVPMPCGHPKACRPVAAEECSACVSEGKLLAQVKGQRREKQT